MARKRSAAEQRCKEIMAFVGGYVSRNGNSPTFREIGEAVGLHCAASVSRYIHRLAQEGRISIDESKPRTISTAARLNDVETVPGAFACSWPTAAKSTWTAICKSPGRLPSPYPLMGYWTPKP